MKISLFTRRCKLDDAKTKAAVRSAVSIAAQHGAEMLVLPGCSMPDSSAIQVMESKHLLQRFSDENSVLILAEVGRTFCFRPNEQPFGPFEQLFAQGAEVTHSKAAELAEALAGGKRIIEVSDRTIGVLLCGENNFLRNSREEYYEPAARFPGIEWPFGYDVLVNPAHTSMGQWNLLHKRFAYLSQAGRSLLYCTNNSHSSWQTSLCVYQDSKKILMGDFVTTSEVRTYAEDDWRIATIEVPRSRGYDS